MRSIQYDVSKRQIRLFDLRSKTVVIDFEDAMQICGNEEVDTNIAFVRLVHNNGDMAAVEKFYADVIVKIANSRPRLEK